MLLLGLNVPELGAVEVKGGVDIPKKGLVNLFFFNTHFIHEQCVLFSYGSSILK